MCVKRIFQSPKGTKDLWLCYQDGTLKLQGYNDGEWGGDKDDCKSTSGYIFLLDNDVVS